MKENLVDKYLSLRRLVGYLGEKEQFGWWQTSLLHPDNRSFLAPVFARTSTLAQYHCLREAARLSFAKTSSTFSFNNLGKPDITC